MVFGRLLIMAMYVESGYRVGSQLPRLTYMCHEGMVYRSKLVNSEKTVE